jgi:hypothetical protein
MVHTRLPPDIRPVIENRERLRVELQRLYDDLMRKGPVDALDLASALDGAFELSQELKRALRIDALTAIALDLDDDPDWYHAV